MRHSWLIRSLSLIFTVTCFLSLKSVSAVENEQSTANENQKRYLLQYKFAPNQFVHFEVKNKNSMFTKFGDAEQTVENESTANKHFRVISVDEDGAALLEMTIDRVQMSAKSDATEKITFDSNAGEKECPQQFRHILATIGRPLARIRFSQTGKAIEVTHKADDPKKVENEVSSHNFLVIFPEKPLSVGDSWQDTFSVPVSVSLTLKKQIKIRRTYTLKSVEGALATITLKTIILSPINNPELEVQLLQRTPEGTILFNMEKGLVESRSSKTDKVVVNPFGPKSLVRGVSSHSEKHVPPNRIAIKIPLPPR